MKIELEVSDKNEGTAEPWWMIIDPKQNMSTRRNACYAIASMITGPFFSREEATQELESRRYHYGKNAVVYCHSACYTNQYKQAYRAAEAKKG